MSHWRNPPPVVILSGSHEHLRIRELKEAIAVADSRNRSVEYVQGTDREELSLILSSTGVFFQEEVLVIVDKPEKVDADLVIRHHESGNNSTVILLHQPGQIKAKTNLAKVAKALPSRFVAKFEKPKPWEESEHATAFCTTEARKQGLKLEEALARSMVHHLGPDLGVLSFELQKLGMFLRSKGKEEVAAEDLKHTLASFAELGPKPIVESVERKDLNAASRALSNMRRTHAGNLGGATLLACAWLSRSITTWLHVSSLHEEGVSLSEISQKVGIHEFVVRKNHLPVARRWGQGRLTSLLKSIALVERSVRGGHVHPWVELECVLFRSLQS